MKKDTAILCLVFLCAAVPIALAGALIAGV